MARSSFPTTGHGSHPTETAGIEYSTDRTAAPKAPSKPWVPLDQVNLRILREYAGGASLGSIASNNHLSERSVRRRLRSACEAFNVTTVIEAVVIAVRRGLL